MTTQLVESQVQPAQSGELHPHEALFTVPKAEQESIPCPQQFAEMVQRPWSQPRSFAAPAGLDKKLYCSTQTLQDLPQLPAVDAPVAALTSLSILTNDIAYGLRIVKQNWSSVKPTKQHPGLFVLPPRHPSLTEHLRSGFAAPRTTSTRRHVPTAGYK